MDVPVQITVSNTVYQFYKGASAHIRGSSTEDIMSDVLENYAAMLDKTIASQKEQDTP